MCKHERARGRNAPKGVTRAYCITRCITHARAFIDRFMVTVLVGSKPSLHCGLPTSECYNNNNNIDIDNK